MAINISGSIVLYKSDKSVQKTIADFLNTPLPVKLYLVDNSPTEALKLSLAQFIADKRVEYIFNGANVGFGAAHNIAIRKVLNETKYHLVLNPDVSFGTSVIEQLVKYLEQHKDVGLVIPKVVYPDGKLQYVCKLLPTPVDLIFRRFLPGKMIEKRLEKFEMREMGYNREVEVPYLSGCFMFLRTDALKKVGLFDERFFMYPEDIDLTRRIYKEYKTMYYPGAEIVHEHARESYKSMKLFYIHIVNMIRYFNKWGWIFDKERRKINREVLSQFK
jgi:GT2 family glycosyltransferase